MSMIVFICKVCGNPYNGHHSRMEHTHTCGKICANKWLQKKLNNEDIIKMYQNGLSTIEIGEKLKVSWVTIARRLRNFNIVIRPRTAHLLTDKNPTKGKGHSEATKEKLRQLAIQQFKNPEARALASHKQCLYLAKNLVSSVSSVEDRVAAELDKRSIHYERQVPIRNPKTGRYQACVDFLINGQALEVNGTYWHADPRFYPQGPTSLSQKRTASAYAKKVAFLKEINIPMVELWESDVDSNVAVAVQNALGRIKQ